MRFLMPRPVGCSYARTHVRIRLRARCACVRARQSLTHQRGHGLIIHNHPLDEITVVTFWVIGVESDVCDDPQIWKLALDGTNSAVDQIVFTPAF